MCVGHCLVHITVEEIIETVPWKLEQTQDGPTWERPWYSGTHGSPVGNRSSASGSLALKDHAKLLPGPKYPRPTLSPKEPQRICSLSFTYIPTLPSRLPAGLDALPPPLSLSQRL